MIVVPGLDRRASLALAGEFLDEIKAAAAVLEELPADAGPALAPAAHRLAGAAATLGAERLAWAARRLQAAAANGGGGEAAALRRETLDTAAETVAALRTALDEAAPGADRRDRALV
jgi:HPt (histidine-containing phosphotransfer) domain-containing protein